MSPACPLTAGRVGVYVLGMAERMLTTGDVAQLLSVDVATVRRWVAAGKLAAVTLPSGRLRFRPETVEELLEPTEVPA